MEQLDDVTRDVRPARKQPKVGIHLGGLVVVVAAADMCVAAETIWFASHDDRCFSMRFRPGNTVNNVNTRIFQRICPANIAVFVKSRFQFHKASDLFALFGGLDQHRHERAVFAGAINGHLDGQYVVVVDRRSHKTSDGCIETLERVMHQDVARANQGKDVRGVIRHRGRDRGAPRRILQFRDIQPGDLFEVDIVVVVRHRKNLIGRQVQLLDNRI